MIRTAIGIGILAILCGIGVIVYRHVQSQDDVANLIPPSVLPTPPKNVPQPTPSTNPLPEPAPAVPAPAPAPMPVVNPSPAQPQQAEKPPAQPQAPAEQGGLVTYKIQPGDSLWEISRKFYKSPNHIKQIADANNLSANATLRIGQMLVIPELRENKSTPADADHEATSARPETAKESSREDAAPMPPTLSRTAPAK
jgi:nucleoid-associated protein YgaU